MDTLNSMKMYSDTDLDTAKVTVSIYFWIGIVFCLTLHYTNKQKQIPIKYNSSYQCLSFPCPIKMNTLQLSSTKKIMIGYFATFVHGLTLMAEWLEQACQ